MGDFMHPLSAYLSLNIQQIYQRFSQWNSMQWCHLLSPHRGPSLQNEIQFHFKQLLVASQEKESILNTLTPRQNCRYFADDTFKRIFLNENHRISIKISLNFVPKGPINNIPALVQIMAWRRPGDKPLSEQMMIRLPTHICVTRLQWVKVSDTDGRHRDMI